MRRAPYVWAALGAVCCGAVLCVLGWYGVSGERFTARQVPYLASCTLPGAALIVAGAVLLAGRDLGGRGRDAVPEPSDPSDPSEPPEEGRLPSSDGPLLRLPGGTLAHRRDCPLVLGKPEAAPASGVRDLAPCPVCEPEHLFEGEGEGGGRGGGRGEGEGRGEGGGEGGAEVSGSGAEVPGPGTGT
ncbi:hypothetical protein [Streptomyces sp. NPDC048442]|uniref:hypothetical protein n=1 Tax=Streptomyces sp. NPDC048442 TaxID=3154823 RepID=UPI00341A9DB9